MKTKLKLIAALGLATSLIFPLQSVAAPTSTSILIYKHIDFDGNWKNNSTAMNASVDGSEQNASSPTDLVNAVDDSVSGFKDTDLYVETIVLSNDIGYGLSVKSFTQGSDGTVKISSSRDVLEYVPDKDFVGTDQFTYTIEDVNGNTSTALVTVSIADEASDSVNIDANNDVVSGEKDADLYVENIVLSNDEGEGIMIIGFTQGDDGLVKFSSSGKGLEYVPDENFKGTDSFTYTIEDVNGNTDTAEVVVTIHD